MDLPTEILAKVCQLTDINTLLALLQVRELRNAISPFLKIVTDDSDQNLKYFTNFTDIQSQSLDSITEVSDSLIYLIEVNDWVKLDHNLFTTKFRQSKGLVVILGDELSYNDPNAAYIQLHPFKKLFRDIPDMGFILPEVVDSVVCLDQLPQDASSVLNIGRLRLEKATCMYLQRIERVNTQFKIYAPCLERLHVMECTNDVFDAFWKETMEGLTQLETTTESYSGDDYNAYDNDYDDDYDDDLDLISKRVYSLENLYFKNLEFASFKHFHSLRNLKFDKLKRVEVLLKDGVDGTAAIWENVQLPELSNIFFFLNPANQFPTVRNVNIPKLAELRLSNIVNDRNRQTEEELFKNMTEESLKCFQKAKYWFLFNALDALKSTNVTQNVIFLKLDIYDQMNAVQLKNAKLPSLEKMEMSLYNNCKQLPRLGGAPNLKKLILTLMSDFDATLIDQIPVYYPGIESLTVKNAVDKVIGLVKPARFKNLTSLSFDGDLFGSSELISSKFQWDLTDLTEFSYELISQDDEGTKITIDLNMPNLKRLRLEDYDYPAVYGEYLTTTSITGCPNLEEIELAAIVEVELADDVGMKLKRLESLPGLPFKKLKARRLPVMESLKYDFQATKKIEEVEEVEEMNPEVARLAGVLVEEADEGDDNEDEAV